MFYYRVANYNYKCNRQETLPSLASLTLHSGGGGATIFHTKISRKLNAFDLKVF